MKLKITQVRSAIRRPADQQATLNALRLKMNKSVIVDDSDTILGMIVKISHLLVIEQLEN